MIWGWVTSFLRPLLDIGLLFVVYLPGESGVRLRRWYYQRRLKRCGKNLIIRPGVHMTGLDCIEIGDDVMIRENVIIQTGRPIPRESDRRSVKSISRMQESKPGIVTIGDRSRIAHGAMILGYGGVFIGEKCGIGPGAIILSESFHHKGDDSAIVYKYSQGADLEEQCVLQGPVVLNDGAGVASHVVVLPGAVIGRDSWVLPNSIVRVGGKVPEMVIAKGDPAVPVQKRRVAGVSNVD